MTGTAADDSGAIVLALEDAFGVSFDDDAFVNVVTIGDLVNVVKAVVPPARHERCLTALAFWRLRRALVDTLGVERAAVRPDARIADLIWKECSTHFERPRAWSRLEQSLALPLPELERPWTLVWSAALLCPAMLLVGLRLAPTSSERWGVVVGMVFVAAGLGILTEPFRVNLPDRIRTVEDLTKAIVLRNASQVGASQEGFTEAQVERLVRDIVVEETGCSVEEVTPDAWLVADLDID